MSERTVPFGIFGSVLVQSKLMICMCQISEAMNESDLKNANIAAASGNLFNPNKLQQHKNKNKGRTSVFYNSVSIYDMQIEFNVYWIA